MRVELVEDRSGTEGTSGGEPGAGRRRAYPLEIGGEAGECVTKKRLRDWARSLDYTALSFGFAVG